MTAKKPVVKVNFQDQDYGNSVVTVLTMLKTMGEKWPDRIKVFTAPAGSIMPPAGSYGIVMTPPVVAKSPEVVAKNELNEM